MTSKPFQKEIFKRFDSIDKHSASITDNLNKCGKALNEVSIIIKQQRNLWLLNICAIIAIAVLINI